MATNSLDTIGVVGLRSTDLMIDNLTSCGDCKNAAPGDAPFLCRAGYPTTLYSVKALYCPDFVPLEALSEEPQGDDRIERDRRHGETAVQRDRRSGANRRQDPDRWNRLTTE